MKKPFQRGLTAVVDTLTDLTLPHRPENPQLMFAVYFSSVLVKFDHDGLATPAAVVHTYAYTICSVFVATENLNPGSCLRPALIHQ